MTQGWDEEAAALRLLEELLGGVGKKVDLGGGAEQLHDFDVRLDDGRVIAVEVTQHISATDLATRSELQKRDWNVTGLVHDWEVVVIPGSDVRVLHKNIGECLIEIELKKLSSFFLTGDMFDESLLTSHSSIAHDALRKLRDAEAVELGASMFELGVRRGFRYSSRPVAGGTVTFGGGNWVGATSAQNVVRATELHLADEGNRCKLRQAQDRAERHLFVWLDSTMPSSSLPLSSGFLPESSPSMSDEIDVLWVATALERPTVWRFDRLLGWQDMTRNGR